MKRLPLFQRPFGARRVIEVGGGHAPYEGVTHAVDKYPEDNTQRADSLHVPDGVEFRQGDLESIPFDSEPKFDFLYASHVLEHVTGAEKAVQEINRVATRGYLETPSPLREQIACPCPFDPADFHVLYCWASNEANTIHVVRKSKDSVGAFCDCDDGALARYLFFVRRKHGIDVEPLLPRDAKTTRLYFKSPLRLEIHASFLEACRSGNCAYRSVRQIRRWSGFPMNLISGRFRTLKRVLVQFRDEPFALTEVSDGDFDEKVIRSRQPSVVLVSARWSGAGKAVAPTANWASQQYAGKAGFFLVDADASPALATRFAVASVPTFLLFRDGKMVREIVGNQGRAALDEALLGCLT